MARKKYEEEHENHERWLISYADFITLLFAFFVVMYAVSSINEGKYRILSESLGTAFGNDKAWPVQPTGGDTQVQPRKTAAQKQREEAMRKEKEDMTEIARDLQDVLAPLVSQGIIRVSQSSRGVKIEINASILFAPGDATLTPESELTLTAIAEILKKDRHALQVEGHTDSVPIKNAMFPSNWELSGMRAGSVVRLFTDNGIAPERLTPVGHGSKFPLASNDTPEGRQRNRRVEIQILADLPDSAKEIPIAERGPLKAN